METSIGKENYEHAELKDLRWRATDEDYSYLPSLVEQTNILRRGGCEDIHSVAGAAGFASINRPVD